MKRVLSLGLFSLGVFGYYLYKNNKKPVVEEDVEDLDLFEIIEPESESIKKEYSIYEDSDYVFKKYDLLELLTDFIDFDNSNNIIEHNIETLKNTLFTEIKYIPVDFQLTKNINTYEKLKKSLNRISHINLEILIETIKEIKKEEYVDFQCIVVEEI